MSLNYSFILELAGRHIASPSRLLDFGCGAADVAALALEKGYDAYGVDSFLGVGHSPENLKIATAKIGSRAMAITPGEPMPFESSFFDVVVANQVFEHIPELDQVRDELARIIRPGGILLALMPTSEVLWENHLKMPWVHRLPLGSERQRTFMKACRRFGFGTNRHVADDDWVNGVVDDLRHNIFHRPAAEYITVFGKKFRLVDEAEPAWARYRINRHRLLKHGSGIFDRGFLDGLIRQIVRRSAGAVLVLERM